MHIGQKVTSLGQIVLRTRLDLSKTRERSDFRGVETQAKPAPCLLNKTVAAKKTFTFLYDDRT